MVSLLEHAFTVDEWDEMGRIGLFEEDARMELIDGRIVDMNPIGDRHASCVDRLNDLFASMVHGIAIVSTQNPLRLSGYSEPQPDVKLLRYRNDFYRFAKPGPLDTLLVVEVADTSLERDQLKGLYYARAGIAQYWIVDLNDERVFEYTDPTGEGYRTQREARADDPLAVDALPQVRLTAAQILG
ncbi:MAG: Uma2 family endonuclease [Acidimicrobiales bacterium]